MLLSVVQDSTDRWKRAQSQRFLQDRSIRSKQLMNRRLSRSLKWSMSPHQSCSHQSQSGLIQRMYWTWPHQSVAMAMDWSAHLYLGPRKQSSTLMGSYSLLDLSSTQAVKQRHLFQFSKSKVPVRHLARLFLICTVQEGPLIRSWL